MNRPEDAMGALMAAVARLREALEQARTDLRSGGPAAVTLALLTIDDALSVGHQSSPGQDPSGAGTPSGEPTTTGLISGGRARRPEPQQPSNAREGGTHGSGAAAGEQGTGEPGGVVGAAGQTPRRPRLRIWLGRRLLGSELRRLFDDALEQSGRSRNNAFLHAYWNGIRDVLRPLIWPDRGGSLSAWEAQDPMTDRMLRTVLEELQGNTPSKADR